MRVVLDTSVLVAAVRSRRGASFEMIRQIPSARFQLAISVGLYTEWQSVLTRPEHLAPGQTAEEALAFLRYFLVDAHLTEIHYLWRPHLRDPDDDMVLECAVAAGAQHIVTHNTKDFRGAEKLGVQPITPAEFITTIRRPS